MHFAAVRGLQIAGERAVVPALRDTRLAGKLTTA
jgi:hypothetical protein